MRYNVYTVYDRIGEEAGSPFICKTDAVAKRHVIVAFRSSNRPEIKMDDHWLWRLGTFDNETMVLNAYDPVRIDLAYDPNDYMEEQSETVQ